ELPGIGIKGPFEGDGESLLLGSGPMIREVEALLDEGVDVDGPMFAGSCAGVQQHVLDNRVCALAMLYYLLEVSPQRVRKFADFGPRLMVCVDCREGFLQLTDQLDRHTGEIVDEIERVFYLVCDPGGQLAERGKLLRLDEAVLRGPQILQRLRQFARTSF